MNRVELVKLIQEQIMTSSEVLEYLEINRSALSSLVNRGKLVPVKEAGTGTGTVRLFLREDVEARKKEAEELRKKHRPYEE
ncbi:helix-turn-helix domain-containing protein [Paenibacillus validus]|uniref:helix-turn-helix domain-containing protein n=1 Tax=Paenibacillus validus TaxID=44253 RepID=UPI000FD9ECDD|nr:helix-turn-helix domain-containing protein [Paenibacillus validus]MED4600102.1 helix-turn-helix domain-containing protein [Paenibacillus validus]MED4605550.1 helix-turn-helix domain-containing protein [Paenibacillus validus]